MSDSPELRVKRHTQQRTQIQSESAWFSHPCLSQLLTHYDKIISILEKGLNVDMIYLDFAKAFFNGSNPSSSIYSLTFPYMYQPAGI